MPCAFSSLFVQGSPPQGVIPGRDPGAAQKTWRGHECSGSQWIVLSPPSGGSPARYVSAGSRRRLVSSALSGYAPRSLEQASIALTAVRRSSIPEPDGHSRHRRHKRRPHAIGRVAFLQPHSSRTIDAWRTEPSLYPAHCRGAISLRSPGRAFTFAARRLSGKPPASSPPCTASGLAWRGWPDSIG